MNDPAFEWDKRKASENRRKHGVSFEEAKSAFLDENARVIPDPEHSDEEDRFVLLGLSLRLRLLVVVHCYRQGYDLIRIISARKADPTERKQYSGFLQ
ncbi:MAG: BrnT family toxin [Gammaproteobacteria bacterium]|nr:BrnT family toxin [Gammaproteobacteria bacterium]MDE0366126.1 BrnT family toxin [Gammaproteobacteria bacterium]